MQSHRVYRNTEEFAVFTMDAVLLLPHQLTNSTDLKPFLFSTIEVYYPKSKHFGIPVAYLAKLCPSTRLYLNEPVSLGGKFRIGVPRACLATFEKKNT